MKHWIVVLGMVALAGCASAPPPVMPSAHYDMWAKGLGIAKGCGIQGYVDADTSAWGFNAVWSRMHSYTFDEPTMASAVDRFREQFMSMDSETKKTMCNEFAIEVAQRRQQIANNNAVVQENIRQTDQAIQSIQNSRPIHCNTINGMTMCN